jgi:hypothetical protein
VQDYDQPASGSSEVHKKPEKKAIFRRLSASLVDLFICGSYAVQVVTKRAVA